jgi:hypothetical protein
LCLPMRASVTNNACSAHTPHVATNYAVRILSVSVNIEDIKVTSYVTH